MHLLRGCSLVLRKTQDFAPLFSLCRPAVAGAEQTVRTLHLQQQLIYMEEEADMDNFESTKNKKAKHARTSDKNKPRKRSNSRKS